MADLAAVEAARNIDGMSVTLTHGDVVTDKTHWPFTQNDEQQAAPVQQATPSTTQSSPVCPAPPGHSHAEIRKAAHAPERWGANTTDATGQHMHTVHHPPVQQHHLLPPLRTTGRVADGKLKRLPS
jgi:hypothetical protein